MLQCPTSSEPLRVTLYEATTPIVTGTGEAVHTCTSNASVHYYSYDDTSIGVSIACT